MSSKARTIPTTMPAMAPPLIPELDEDADSLALAEDLAESRSLGISVTVWNPPTLVTTETIGVCSVGEGVVVGSFFSEGLGAVCKQSV